MLCFAVPGTVAGVSYILAFNSAPVYLTGTAAIVIISMVMRNVPVGIRAGIAGLGQIDKSLDEASLSLRAGSLRTITHILLPLLRPAILSALIYSFVRAITTVSAIVFLVTPDTRVATAYILNRVEDGEYGVAIAYGSILIVVMLAIIFLFDWLIGEARISRSKAKTRRNTMTEKHFVELRNVTKRFGANTVIENINLAIPQGQMVTLLGPSGCGKTTVLRLVAGLEKPTEGQIYIDGEDVTHRSIQQRDICMVFQSYALFPHMSLGENVGYGLKMLGVSRAEIKTRVKEALAMVDLEGFEDRYVDQISGGQQQRVALARALILKPKVLLFDEPLSNLDANLRRSMRDKIRELQKQFNITSLYVTHDQSEAFAVSDTVLVMNKGNIMQIGSPQDLYRQPASRFMASFMGDANLFPARFSEDVVEIHGYRLPRPLHFATQGEGTVGVRPEAITLSQHGEASQHCTIRHVAYMGPQYEVIVDWHGQEILLQVNATRLQPDVGDAYYLEIHPYGMFVLAEAA